MKTLRTLATFLLLALALMPAHPAVITFNATGVSDVSGFLQFDSSMFTGSPLDFVPNTEIVGFSMTVLGETFDLGDVDTTAFTLIDSAAVPPIIVNGAGGPDNGSLRIFFYPDGGNGTPTDGDAALAYFLPDFSVAVLPVLWVVSNAVPEPATLLLVGLCFAARGLTRRKHPSRVMHP